MILVSSLWREYLTRTLGQGTRSFSNLPKARVRHTFPALHTRARIGEDLEGLNT